MASASKILPPSDSSRPEWSILGKLTRNPNLYPAGVSDDEAASIMRTSLEQAWIERPDEVLAACCASKLRSRSRELASRPGQFSEYLSFLKDRLWLNNENGHIPEAGDKERGPSAFGIKYWDPKSGGLASYMRARVTWLDADWATEQSEKSKNVSTEVLSAQGVDLDENSEFVRPRRQSNLDDAADESEIAAEGVDLREERKQLHRTAGIDEKDDAAETDIPKDEIRRSESEAETVARGRSERLEALRNSQDDEIVLSSPNRGEYAFFSVALGRSIEPLDTPDDREGQLRQLAGETMGKLCTDMPDLEDARAALQDWEPGKNSFFRYFPEVSEYVVEKVAKPEVVAPKVTPTVEQNIESLGRFMGLSGDKVRPETVTPQQEIEKDAARLDEPAGFFAHHQMGADTLRASEMWNARATEQTVNAPDRPDYLFLCDRLNIEPTEDIGPDELHATIKEMAMEWMTTTSRNPQITQALYPAIKAWNPAEGFMGETMMEHLSEFARRRATPDLSQSLGDELAGSVLDTLSAQRDAQAELPPEMQAAALESCARELGRKSRTKEIEPIQPDLFSSGGLSL